MRVPRRRPHPAVLGPFLLGTLLFWTSPGRSGEEDYPPITAEQITAGDYRPNEKRSITGKFQELTNQELRLFDLDARLLLTNPALARKILGFTAQEDNLRVLGFFREPDPKSESNLPVFMIEGIQEAEPDLDLFEKKLKDLLASPERSVDDLIRLGREITDFVKQFGARELVHTARQAFAEAYALANQVLPTDDSAGRLSIIQDVYVALGDDPLAVQLLKVQIKQFPESATTRDFLVKLRCVEWEDEWLTYAEYKQRLGFVPLGGRWVKPDRKEFLALVKKLSRLNQTNMILRVRTNKEYMVLARSGRVETGMTRKELSLAMGMPDRVEREVMDRQEIDQWNYGDRRVYLLDGHVVATVP